MPIRVHCPSCDERFVTSKRYRGKRVRCSKCGEPIKIRPKKAAALLGSLLGGGPGEDDASSDEDAVPIDEAPKGVVGGSADVLDFLAEEGGPDGVKAGAVYVPSVNADSVDEEADPLAETPGQAWSKPSRDETPAKGARGKRLALVGVVAAIALVTVGGAWFVMGGSDDRGAVNRAIANRVAQAPTPSASDQRPSPAPSKSTPPPKAKTPPGQPEVPAGPPATVVVAKLEVEEGWLSSKRQIRLTVQNDGEKPLTEVTINAGVVSGLFEGSALMSTDFEHRFDSPLAAGASQEVVLEPAEGSAMATQKLPPRAGIRARVVAVK